MTIRIVFLSLLILFFISLSTPSFSYALGLSFTKALLIGLFFMELKMAHRLWLIMYSATMVITTLVIFFLAT